MGDIFFGFDMPSFALGNYPTLGAGWKLFLSLARLLFTMLTAVSLSTFCENRECTMTCMIISVYSGPAIAIKQQFAAIEIDHGACLRHEACPCNTSSFSRESTH